MTTDIIGKLTFREYELDLMSGRFKLALDFMPPPLNLKPQISKGTSANRLEGGRVVSRKAENRKWNWGVHIKGDSEAELAMGLRDLQEFLDQAGDPSYPVCFEFRSNSDVGFEPLWGQYGANLRYEILAGSASLSRKYPVSDLRARGLPNCRVSTIVKPYAEGIQQALGSAVGGVFEDVIGSLDGRSFGTIIPPAATNKHLNPVFSHGTWDNGWTATSLTATENTDRDFITHGKSSAKLTDPSGGGQWTESLAVGNTNTHMLSFYAKLPDGGAISATQAQIFYSTAKTTTYTALGNGWYRLSASVTGIAIGTATGIEVKAGYTIYVDGFHTQEIAYLTPAAHGEMLGCAWTGTAHASTTTRTAGRVRIDTGESMDLAEGTIRMIWRTAYANTHPVDLFLWSSGASSLRAYFESSDDKFYLLDHTNTISSASAESFSAGDDIVLHFVFKPGSLKIYRDGAEVATGSTYTPPTLGSDLYIGSDHAAANHGGGTFSGLETFSRGMTATEVLNDYNNILEHIEDGRRLSTIPYLWTKDGDEVIDNVDDSDQDNYTVIAGIPGSAQAKTWIRSKTIMDAVKNGFWFLKSLMPYNKFEDPTARWYDDQQGTVDAACSGGERDDRTISAATSWAGLQGLNWPEEFRGKVHFFARLSADASIDVLTEPSLYIGSGLTFYGTQKTLSLTTTHKWFYLGSLFMDYDDWLPDAEKYAGWTVRFDKANGNVNLRSDLFMAVNGDALFSDGGVPSGTSYFITHAMKTYRVTSAGILTTHLPSKGNRIELDPEKYNFLWACLAKHNDAHVIADTLTFVSIKITPRWALL